MTSRLWEEIRARNIRISDPSTPRDELMGLIREQLEALEEEREQDRALTSLRSRFREFEIELRGLERRFPGLSDDAFWQQLRATLTSAYGKRITEIEDNTRRLEE